MARARATLSGENFATTIEMRGHHLVADEPAALGGGDVGPAPYDLLLASLGACTTITLKMYADRKGWPLKSVGVDLHYQGGGEGRAKIDRALDLVGELDETQRARLAEIAERTPVTLTLRGGVDIATTLKPDAAWAAHEAELEEGLLESFPASDPLSATRPGEGAD